MVEQEPLRLRMINDVLREPGPNMAPPKRRKAKAKRTNSTMSLGNIRKYFSNICHDKDLSSDGEKEGGAGGSKRKQVDCVEHLPVHGSKKSRRTLTEATNYVGSIDSGTLCPNVLGGNSICGREPDARRRNWVGFKEKEGGTIQGLKTRPHEYQ